MEKVLIVGASSGMGRLLVRRLARRCEVVGVSREPWEGTPPHFPFYQADARKRAFEDILRKENPDAVVHLGFVRHFRDAAESRHEMNVRGTRRLLDHCARHGVKKVVVVSTSYVYGAFPENPFFMDEEHPLSASQNYPEIRDLVEVDTLATAFMWKYPEIRTSILRPVPTLGHYSRNSIVTYLQMRPVIVMMGFNPMLQVMHEDDLAEAISLAVQQGLRGVYNVIGPGEVPLHVAIEETGGSALALPEFLARPALQLAFRAGLFPLPASAIDFIKYSCTISGGRFRDETGFRPLFGLTETFRSIRPLEV